MTAGWADRGERLNIAWWTPGQDKPARGFWDQGWLEEVLTKAPPGVTLDHLSQPPPTGGAVVIIPARWNIDRIADIQEAIQNLEWVLLVLTGDEEGVFPREQLRHERMITWVQTPHVLHEGERGVGDGAPPEMRALLPDDPPDKLLDWMFAGQITNEHRRQMMQELQDQSNGSKLFTDTFGSGLEYPDYVAELLTAKVVPCPGGNFTPDTFRLFEALEAGCAPVVRRDSEPYWLRTFGEVPPFTFSNRWPAGVSNALQDFPDTATRAQCWWAKRRRHEAIQFWTDVCSLMDRPLPIPATTVLVATSSSPADPSTKIFELTMDSIRERLPEQEILVMMDGLHDHHAYRRSEYAEYRRRVAWLSTRKYSAVPLFFENHVHQASMTAAALQEVRTPLILFVEHDAPLLGDWPVEQLEAVILNDQVDLIRMHHEDRILPDHEHLMTTPVVSYNSLPLRGTKQWSQRPHLARSDLYRSMLSEHFTPDSSTMIEDVVHGPAQTDDWLMRMTIYHPDGDIKRSEHLDGRAGEDKVPMIF